MRASLPDILTRGPVPLAPDNFTPLSRTPWAGEDLARSYKSRIAPAGARIGEAWEFSCDPAFPSRVRASGETLLELIAAHRDAVLGSGAGACDILVKLLNAREPLSLQVHPRDDDPDLARGECGKPESWLVLAAAPGAGIYLGFSRPVAKDELRRALAQGDAARALLHFEPVRPGDYFEIEPGVPHAIGPGVTLLEPQRVVPGHAGKTFRMWDWGRSDGGVPRALHVEQSLKLIDPERQVGAAFAASLRRAPERVAEAHGLRLTAYPPNASYRTYLFQADAGARFDWCVHGGYGALVMLEGALDAQAFGASGAPVHLEAGEPALLPAAAMPLVGRAAPGTRFCVVVPAQSHISVDG